MSRPDWKHDRFRDDLWLWRDAQNELLPLAQSAHDSDPKWPPNGEYIAFISSRPVLSEASEESRSTEDAKVDGDKEVGRVWVIAVNGGDAFPLYSERLKAHTFPWKADSTGILLSAPEPLSKAR